MLGPLLIRSIGLSGGRRSMPMSRARLLERLLSYTDVKAAMEEAPADAAGGPVLPMHFRKGGTALQLFTAIATLGTPQDITLQELRIECFFPLDEATAAILRGWAK